MSANWRSSEVIEVLRPVGPSSGVINVMRRCYLMQCLNRPSTRGTKKRPPGNPGAVSFMPSSMTQPIDESAR